MYVVTVTLVAEPGHVDALKSRVVRQAADTLREESACRSFDVCFDPEDAPAVFLYEIYETPEDYLAHLDREHTRAFRSDTAPWIAERTVRVWRRL